jgi:hypothetical protein
MSFSLHTFVLKSTIFAISGEGIAEIEHVFVEISVYLHTKL